MKSNNETPGANNYPFFGFKIRLARPRVLSYDKNEDCSSKIMATKNALLVLTAATFLASCSSDGVSDQEKKTGLKSQAANPTNIANQQKKAEIPDYVLSPYTEESYPKTFAKYGNRMPELERFRKLAAEIAATNPECDKVIASEVSDRGTYSDMQFFVDCENMKRYRFSESELAQGNTMAVSEVDKAYSMSEATSLCKDLIKQSVVHPSTLDMNLFDVGYKKFPANGNVWISIDFKAKNSFGLELKYQAKCIFQPENPNGEITISERS